MEKQKLCRLIMAAVMGAVAFILMYFSFFVPVVSPFAEFDFSALPELIGGYILGPVGAVEIISIKLILKILIKGSSSMMTGEIQNFLLSTAYVLPAVICYRKLRTRKAAVLGLIIGSVISIILAIVTNLYLIFPIYIKLYGMNWDAIVKICSEVNPWIIDVPSMLAFSVIPFNVILRFASSLLVMLVYKKVSVPLKKLIQ